MVLIIDLDLRKKYCPPKIVTMTEDVTVYVTEQQVCQPSFNILTLC